MRTTSLLLAAISLVLSTAAQTVSTQTPTKCVDRLAPCSEGFYCKSSMGCTHDQVCGGTCHTRTTLRLIGESTWVVVYPSASSPTTTTTTSVLSGIPPVVLPPPSVLFPATSIPFVIPPVVLSPPTLFSTTPIPSVTPPIPLPPPGYTGCYAHMGWGECGQGFTCRPTGPCYKSRFCGGACVATVNRATRTLKTEVASNMATAKPPGAEKVLLTTLVVVTKGESMALATSRPKLVTRD